MAAPHPNEFETKTDPSRGDPQEGSLRKINKLLAQGLPQKQSSTRSSAGIQTAAGTVATLASGEVVEIQNLGTNPLFVKRGASASTSSFDFILQGAASNDDGTGGFTRIDDFVGAVSVAGTSPRFVATKLS